MSKTAVQEFLDRALAAVPEDKREEVRALYSRAGDEMATRDRSLEEMTAQVRDTATKQNEWWTAHKDTVAENKELKAKAAAGGGNGNVNLDDINKRLDDTRGELLGTGAALMAIGTRIAVGHLKEFGEVLDMEDMTNKAIKAGVTLQQFYDHSVSPRRQELTEAAGKKAIEEAEARGRKAGEEETTKRLSGQQMPFPGPSTAPITTLSGLKKPADGVAPTNVLEAAVATAMGVVNAQNGT